jgi:ADP-ribosylglycohydrolase
VDAIPSTRWPLVHGCLLGGAIGDALGAPVESLSLSRIREQHGPAGVPAVPSTASAGNPLTSSGRPLFGLLSFDGRISEETQLALLTAEALLRAQVSFRTRAVSDAPPRPLTVIAQETYIAWLAGQGEQLPGRRIRSRSDLAGREPFTSRRGTSRTVVEAMRRAIEPQRAGKPLGTTAQPVNNSKGSAAVVRVASCGFTDEPATAFGSGCDIAALTHGHPSGWLSAGTFAAVIHGLYSQQLSIRGAVHQAQAELSRQPRHEEVSAAVAAAITLADNGSPTAEAVESLGRGWTAPEALAIAIYAALSAETAGGPAPEVFERGLRLAVNHSGDSDATGALCGSLLGARYGVQGIPASWAHDSEVAGVIYRLTRDYCIEHGFSAPRDDYGSAPEYWYSRYPG